MAQDYNSTLNLPQTEFPMRGNLPKREPETLQKWEDERLYYKMIEKNKGKPSYVLHDGPPYADGEIHLGHALNKSLKDFIVKYKNMSGFCSPYVPGWDTHGLPIELKEMKTIGVKDGAAFYDFSAEAVAELFSTYLNPRVAAIMKEAAGN